MGRILLPTIILIISGVVFFVFTEPMITDPKSVDVATKQLVGGVLALKQEKQILTKALDDSRRLKQRIGELYDQLEAISANQLKRLDTFLPDEVDEVQLIVDVNNIAARSGMSISEVQATLNDTERSFNRKEVASSATNVNPKVTPMTLSFEVAGSYSQLRSFLDNLGQSLQIMDVNSLSFSLKETTTEAELPTYQISLTTYFIK